jgi:hypothetical protein
MRRLVYIVRHSVVPINLPLLTMPLYSLVKTPLVYNDKKYSVLFITFYPSSTARNVETILTTNTVRYRVFGLCKRKYMSKRSPRLMPYITHSLMREGVYMSKLSGD